MAFDIANALQPATFNPSGVMQAVQSNRLAQAQDARAQAEATMRSTEFQNQLADRAAAQQQGDAKTALATAQYVLQSQQPKALLQSLSQTNPKVAEFLDAATAHHGIDWNAATDQDIRGMAQTLIAHYGSQLGQGPPVAKTESVGPNASLVTVGQDASGNPTAAPLYTAPEAFTGAPTPMVLNGKPVMAVRGSAGTIRPIPGATPYQAPSQAGNTPPSGYRLSTMTPGTYEYIPGGPADPNKPQPTNFSGREAQMFQRVLSSASEANAAIQNIMELPMGASSGVFGVGASPGTGMLASAKGVLTNKLSSQETQDYESMMPGLGRSLSTIETAGLAPNGALTGQMGKLDLREGDTGYTKLRKMAEYRQIVVKGIETNLDNPRIPKEQKDVVRRIISEVKATIPFTHHDITELQRRQLKNPDLTIAQLVQGQGLGASSSLPSNSAPPAASGWTVTKKP